MENNHEFCCHGCRRVFSIFGEEVLEIRKAEKPFKQIIEEPEGSEAFLRIDGMHCSSCEILIQKMGERINGILSISTNYATSTAKVIYDPEQIIESELPDLISMSGYRARFHGTDSSQFDEDKALFRVIFGVILAGWVMMLNLTFFYPVDLGLVTVHELEPIGWLAFSVVPKVMLIFTTPLIFLVGFQKTMLFGGVNGVAQNLRKANKSKPVT